MLALAGTFIHTYQADERSPDKFVMNFLVIFFLFAMINQNVANPGTHRLIQTDTERIPVPTGNFRNCHEPGLAAQSV